MITLGDKPSSIQSPVLAELLLAPSIPGLGNAVVSGNLTNEQFCNFWRKAAAQADLRGNLANLRQLLTLLNQAPARTTLWGELLTDQYTGLLLLSEGSFKKAIFHFQRQLYFAQLLHDPTELALAHLDLAQANLYILELKRVEEYLQEAERWALQSEEPALLVKVLNRQAELAAHFHLTDKSIEKATRALSLARQYRLRLEQAFALNWLGVSWMYRLEWQRSEEALREAVRIRQTVHNSRGQAEALLNLCRLYLKTNNFAAAEAALDTSLTIMQGLQNQLGVAQGFYHKALLLYQSTQPEAALHWTKLTVKARLQHAEPTRLAQSYSLLGQIYASLGQSPQALICHLKVLRLYKSGRVTPQWIDLLVEAGDYLLRVKEVPNIDTSRYWQHGLRSYKLAIEIIEINQDLYYLAPVLGRIARALLRLDGLQGLDEAVRCYRLQLKLIGDIDSPFVPLEEAISQRVEALTGLQICASLSRRPQI